MFVNRVFYSILTHWRLSLLSVLIESSFTGEMQWEITPFTTMISKVCKHGNCLLYWHIEDLIKLVLFYRWNAMKFREHGE